MRNTSIAVFVGLIAIMYDAAPSVAQPATEITGKTCAQLFRSCFKPCARNKGDPAWRACEVDCNAGMRSCRSTGTWVSKGATVTPPKR